MLIIKFAIKQTRRSPPPRMAVVIAAAIFWLCQNSPSTNVQGCTLVDERAILAAENQQPRRERRGTVLNVSHGMGYPARMPVVPNRNEFFALQKTRSQKCTRMYIFDEVVAVGFNTLRYDAKRCRGRRVLNPPHE